MIPARIESAVQTFTHEDKSLRVFLRGDEPWFVAADACAALGIDKHRDALTRLDSDERGSVVVDTPGGPQDVGAISESGLYTLILRSRKPQAQPFRRWVTHEVLPTIRKTGAYTADESAALVGLQSQITELRTMLESRAVRVGPNPEVVSKLQAAEVALVSARGLIDDAIKPMHAALQRLGIKSMVFPSTLAE